MKKLLITVIAGMLLTSCTKNVGFTEVPKEGAEVPKINCYVCELRKIDPICGTIQIIDSCMTTEQMKSWTASMYISRTDFTQTLSCQ